MKATKDNARRVRTIIKIVPIISASALILHCGLLLLGYTPELIRTAFAFSTIGTATMIIASYYFHFCTTHRLLILYNETVSDCCGFQIGTGFGEYLTTARLAVFIFGVLLLLYILTHFNSFCCDTKRLE